METFREQLDFVLAMHNRLRLTSLEPGTPEGHFVNENTAIRLAAMMEGQCLKPPSEPKCKGLGEHEREAAQESWFDDLTDAERAVRTLFLFRNLIVHNRGHLELTSIHRTWAESRSYAWFCDQHRDARVAEHNLLCLSADSVITPLVNGCREYWKWRGQP